MSPVPFLLPPDGADAVPTDTEIVVAGAPAAVLEVIVDGAPVRGAHARLADRTVFAPEAPFAPGSEVEVRVTAPDELPPATFRVGDGPADAPSALPEVGPLSATRTAHGTWAFTVTAEQPDATTYGMFQVAYRVADGELATVDALWLADGPSEGTWEDDAPPGSYCAGIGYVDVAGHATEPIEVCAELPEPAAPDEAGCATAGGAPALIALLAPALVRRRRRAPRI